MTATPASLEQARKLLKVAEARDKHDLSRWRPAHICFDGYPIIVDDSAIADIAAALDVGADADLNTLCDEAEKVLEALECDRIKG